MIWFKPYCVYQEKKALAVRLLSNLSYNLCTTDIYSCFSCDLGKYFDCANSFWSKFDYLLLFNHLYPSNHNTDTIAINIVIPKSFKFKLLTWKKFEKTGMYKMANSSIKVAPIINGNRIFLFLKLSKKLYVNERLVKLKNTLAKMSVVKTIALVVSSLLPFWTANW